MAAHRGFLRKFGEPAGGKLNRLKEGLHSKRALTSELSQVYTAEPALVYDYRPETQRVDILLKNYPNIPPLRDLPIGQTGGDLMFIRSFQTVVAGAARPTVGIVLFPRSDSTLSWALNTASDPATNQNHRPQGAVFIDTVMTTQEAPGIPHLNPNAGPTDLDYLGRGDSALVHRSGSYIMFKENGDIVIKAAGDIYAGGLDITVDDYADAARKGDDADGGPGVGGIQGGSDRVHLG